VRDPRRGQEARALPELAEPIIVNLAEVTKAAGKLKLTP